jgi:serine/threonine-protein kinase PknK
VRKLQPQARPRALLQANRLLVAALGAAGRTDDAKQTLARIAAQCAELGMIRYLLDGGPQVVALLAELRDDLHSDRWNPVWPAIPSAFLDTMVSEAQRTGSDAASQSAGPT